jgi:hypothetical protein
MESSRRKTECQDRLLDRQCRQAARSALVVVCFLAIVWLRGALPAVQAQQAESTDVPKEHTVKAVFLYGFGRYVEWPKTAFGRPTSPFVIGVLGEDMFGGALDEIAKKKTIQGRPIVIKRFANMEAFKEPCQILFVSRSLTTEEQAALIAKTAGKPIFVVGESPGFAEHGATANFYADGDRIAIEINTDAVRRAQLRVDARLLNLAKRVGATQTTATN